MVKQLHYWLTILVAVALIGFLIWPFITPLIFALVFAHILYPLHKKFSKKIHANLSALIITLCVIIISLAVLSYGFKLLLDELGEAYIFVSNLDIAHIAAGNEAAANLVKDISRIAFSSTITKFSGMLSSLPQVIISVLLLFVGLFYFLLDGDKLWSGVQQILPFKPQEKTIFVKATMNYINAFVNVWLIIGVLQAVVAGIGLWLFGFPSPLVFAMCAGLLSIIPIVGPYVLYLPLGLVAVMTGNANAGVGIIIYGLGLSSVLDYVVRPHYAGRWSQIHPFVVLLGMLSGLMLLGPAGIIIGPVILFVCLALLTTTKK